MSDIASVPMDEIVYSSLQDIAIKNRLAASSFTETPRCCMANTYPKLSPIKVRDEDMAETPFKLVAIDLSPQTTVPPLPPLKPSKEVSEKGIPWDLVVDAIKSSHGSGKPKKVSPLSIYKPSTNVSSTSLKPIVTTTYSLKDSGYDIRPCAISTKAQCLAQSRLHEFDSSTATFQDNTNPHLSNLIIGPENTTYFVSGADKLGATARDLLSNINFRVANENSVAFNTNLVHGGACVWDQHHEMCVSEAHLGHFKTQQNVITYFKPEHKTRFIPSIYNDNRSIYENKLQIDQYKQHCLSTEWRNSWWLANAVRHVDGFGGLDFIYLDSEDIEGRPLQDFSSIKDISEQCLNQSQNHCIAPCQIQQNTIFAQDCVYSSRAWPDWEKIVGSNQGWVSINGFKEPNQSYFNSVKNTFASQKLRSADFLEAQSYLLLALQCATFVSLAKWFTFVYESIQTFLGQQNTKQQCVLSKTSFTSSSLEIIAQALICTFDAFRGDRNLKASKAVANILGGTEINSVDEIASTFETKIGLTQTHSNFVAALVCIGVHTYQSDYTLKAKFQNTILEQDALLHILCKYILCIYLTIKHNENRLNHVVDLADSILLQFNYNTEQRIRDMTTTLQTHSEINRQAFENIDKAKKFLGLSTY